MRDVTRREGLALGFGTAAVLAAASRQALASPISPAPASLQALAAVKGLRFGSCVSAGSGGGIGNARYTALLNAECGLLVPENELKWQAIRPTATTFDFAGCDAILAWATRNGMPMRGHNLLWNRPEWMPRWLESHDFGPQPIAAAELMLTTHIRTVCARYQGRILDYDVVNETVLPEDGSLARTALSSAIGGTETLVDLAFHVAREAAPGARLVYNDYMSWEAGNDRHRAGVLRLLEGFRKRGTPVDALGIQSHLVVSQAARPQEKAWRAFIDAVVAMGYGLAITEFDVRDGGLPADIGLRDAGVAAAARAYLDMMLAYPQLRDVLVWGMSDAYSWLQNFEPRSDGMATRGNPYDAAFVAKPMRAAIAAAFTAAPSR